MRFPHVVFASALAAASLLSAAEPRPNVLFIAVDDLRDWVGYLGHNGQTITPNIDRLAARGVAFSQSYCAAPVCNPSRAALMSGLRPFTSGVYNNGDDWRPVIPEDKTLITTFRRAGYKTLGAGKIYHGGYDRTSEWDDYAPDKKKDPAPPTDEHGVGGIAFARLDCKDEDMADYAIASYGVEQLGKAHEKPFLLTVGLHKPHMPWNVPQKYFDMHPLDKIELPPYLQDDLADLPEEGVRMARPQGDHAKMAASGRWKEAVQAYLASITFCDTMVGRLLDALDKSAYKDNTIIVFWGDHGWHLGEKDHWRKFALWEAATKAPLLWSVPGVTKSGGRSERPVDFMSIYPTLCDLCGIDLPKHVEGTSIKSLLLDPQAPWDKPAITTHEFKNHAVRSEGWRYIRYAGGGEELYDEATDPEEWKNLAGDPAFAQKKAELGKWLPASNSPEAKSAKKGGQGKGKGKGKAAGQKKEDD